MSFIILAVEAVLQEDGADDDHNKLVVVEAEEAGAVRKVLDNPSRSN